MPAGAGWRWIVEGFGLFRRAPLIWLLLVGMLFAFSLLTSMVPAVGAVVLYVVSPGLLAGMLIGCADLRAGRELSGQHLLAGFSRSAYRLLWLGVFYTLAQVLLLGLLLVAGAGLPLDPLAEVPTLPPPAELSLGLVALALLVSVLMTMLIWFAPALIVFRDQSVWPAMRMSLAACLFNWKAYAVNALAMMVLLLLAVLPMLVGLLVWLPVMVCGLFCAYCEIFGEPAAGNKAT